jgi:hypothetical protein
MKRPKQHQIEDQACKQFEACLPKHWVVRCQTHDYGIDREVEIFDQTASTDPVSTGHVFKVQVKGTEDAKMSSKGDAVKFRLEVDRASYLCNEIAVPVFFVLSDVRSKRTWWYPIQLDKDLKHRVAVASKEEKKTVVLNIPARNVLPETLECLVGALDDIEMSHACDSFVELPQQSFDNLSLSLDEIAKLEERFTDKVFIAKATKFWRSKDFDGLETAAKDALANASSSTSTKVSAILCIEKAHEHRIMGSPMLRAELDQVYLRTAYAIKRVTQGEDKGWRLFSAIVWRAALLGTASSNDFALFLNNKIQKEEGGTGGLDFVCRITLGIARQQALKKLFRTYNQCVRLIALAGTSGEYWMIPQATLRIAHALPPVFIHLWGERLERTATSFRDHFRELLSRAVATSLALREWDDTAELVHTAFTINSQDNQKQYQETYDWATRTLSAIGDEARRRTWLDWLENSSKTFNPKENAIEPEFPDIPAGEEYQIYILTARAMGVNLDDPKDELAQIINVGLADLNPERVLRRCKHLFVYLGHRGIPAEMLQLPTAGSKYLRCLKKNVVLCGLSLDQIYESMNLQHCKGCEHVDPWPDDWKWTRSWDRAESEKETHKLFRKIIQGR